MKTTTLLTGMLLLSAPTLAKADTMPDICKSVANYAAQALDLRFSDGSFSDKENPKTIVMKRNLKKYPMTVKDLGNCEDNINLKESWCRVAGGSPEVYQVDVARKETDGSYPFATVIVTYNRGGCWVDEVVSQ